MDVPVVYDPHCPAGVFLCSADEETGGISGGGRCGAERIRLGGGGKPLHEGVGDHNPAEKAMPFLPDYPDALPKGESLLGLTRSWLVKENEDRIAFYTAQEEDDPT